jgi:ABC-2 type transport system permease protein
MHKVRVIIRKEWAEVFKNRMVLFTVAFLPLVMTAIPLAVLFGMRGEAGMEGMNATDMPAQFNALCPPALNGGECFQVFLVSQFMIMFMIIPLAIPATIAAYSIIGEKTTRSLEPLLATPISTLELLLGKSLAALIPAVLATFAAFGMFVVGAGLIVSNRSVLAALLDARWLIAIFIAGPLLALLAVVFGIMVSSRVNDPRVAEQLSALLIVPLLALFFGQMAGLFVLNRALIFWISAVLLALDALAVYLAVQLFQRETILTRWK